MPLRKLCKWEPSPDAPPPPGYTFVIRKVNSVTEPDEFYWSLYFYGDRVNGGISGTKEDAIRAIRDYRYQHIISSFLWDSESCSWERM